DPSPQQAVEHAKQRVLQVDAEREQPIEKGGDRRQVLAQAPVAIGQPQTGRVLERVERAALDFACEEQEIELAQGGARIDRFEIVVGAEQALAAGLTLALSNGAERVEPARDGGEKTLLGFHVGCDRPEQRLLGLVGAVRATEALYR